MEERTHIELSQDDWRVVLLMSKRGKHPAEVLVEWWRRALGYTKEDWAGLPDGTFGPMDYCVSAEDSEKLMAVLMADPVMVRAARMVWLDIGPGICEDDNP